jgi:hypothetical protein
MRDVYKIERGGDVSNYASMVRVSKELRSGCPQVTYEFSRRAVRAATSASSIGKDGFVVFGTCKSSDFRTFDYLQIVEALASPIAAGADLESALEKKFSTLRDEWKAGVALSSSAVDMILHPAYQKIIGMGSSALPLLLRELEREPDHWFWALASISCENPVPMDDAGDLDRMAMRWLAWGRTRGLI